MLSCTHSPPIIKRTRCTPRPFSSGGGGKRMEHVVVTLFGFSFKPLGFLFPLLGAISALVALALSVRGNAPLADRGQRRLLAALRGAALATVVFCLLQPVFSVRKGEREKQRFTVLLDASPSMTREGGRFPKAEEYLKA